MNEQLKFLIELQELDSAILSIAEKAESLPRKLEQYKTPLKEAHDAYQKANLSYDSLNKKKKDKDLKLDEIQDKVNKLKTRGSDIKTNKEYEAHLKEIQVFEKNMSDIEDEILVMMEEIDSFEKELKSEELKVKKAEEELKEQEVILGSEQKQFQADLDKEKAKRAEFVSRIKEEHYRSYMNLMDRLGDKVVVETKNEVCLGCNTNIPPQLYNDIRKNDELQHCFYCTRFLYYKESPPQDDQGQDLAPSA